MKIGALHVELRLLTPFDIYVQDRRHPFLDVSSFCGYNELELAMVEEFIISTA